jgi:hypothetical protein
MRLPGAAISVKGPPTTGNDAILRILTLKSKPSLISALSMSSVLTKASHGAETASCRTQSVIRATLCHLRPGLKWSGQVPACRGPE